MHLLLLLFLLLLSHTLLSMHLIVLYLKFTHLLIHLLKLLSFVLLLMHFDRVPELLFSFISDNCCVCFFLWYLLMLVSLYLFIHLLMLLLLLHSVYPSTTASDCTGWDSGPTCRLRLLLLLHSVYPSAVASDCIVVDAPDRTPAMLFSFISVSRCVCFFFVVSVDATIAVSSSIYGLMFCPVDSCSCCWA